MIASAYYNCSHWKGMQGIVDPDDLDPTKHDLLVLHGGEDISPSLYKQPPVHTSAPPHPSERDELELNLIEKALDLEMPILGICRGAQLLCVMGGGSLWQHVEGHGFGSHELIVDGELYKTNSCHHQMMIPTEDMRVLGYCNPLSERKFAAEDEPVVTDTNEPEIVFIPHFKALCVQGHPEWLSHTHDLNRLTKHFLKELLNVEIHGRGP